MQFFTSAVTTLQTLVVALVRALPYGVLSICLRATGRITLRQSHKGLNS